MRIAVVSILLSLVAMCGTANSSMAKEPALDADSQSKPVIQSMCNFYKGLGAVSFTASETAKGATSAGQYSVKMKRSPLLFALTSTDRDRGWAISGGKTLVVYSPLANVYEESGAAAKMSDISSASSYIHLVSSLSDWLWERLLDTHPGDAIASAFSTVKYIGLEDIGTHKCHHLQLTYRKANWEETFRFGGTQNVHKIVWSPKEIWVDTGKQPWLRQETAASSTTTIMNVEKPVTSVNESTVVDIYDNHQLNPTFTDRDFQFQPLQRAQLVPNVEESLEYDEAVKQMDAPDSNK